MPGKQAIVFIILLILSLTASARQTVGYVENVSVYPGALHMHAKVDSGATNSSLNCNCSRIIQQDGADWVKFTLVDMNGKTFSTTKKVVRYSRVVQHTGYTQRRPVVRLGICMAGIYRDVEVNLVNRGDFNYQMLIGRSFMLNDFLIAPDKKFITKPNCTTNK